MVSQQYHGDGLRRDDWRYHTNHSRRFQKEIFEGRKVVAKFEAVLETGLETSQVIHVPQIAIKKRKPLENKRRKHSQQGQAGSVSSAIPLTIIPEEPDPTPALKKLLSPTGADRNQTATLGVAMTGSAPRQRETCWQCACGLRFYGHGSVRGR